MVKVPKTIEQIFDSFPLKTYPPIPNSTPSTDQLREQDRYFFESSSCNEDTNFTFGVHNIIELKSHDKIRYIPSDPISLGNSLILCFKNKLKMPSSTNQFKSKNSILTMSFNASPDNHLPILIEDNKETRNIRSAASIHKSVANKSFQNDSECLMINQLIDDKFYDVWLLCLLSEKLDIETMHKLFKFDDEIKSNKFISDLTLSNLLIDIQHWNSLKIKHSHLFDISSKLDLATRIKNQSFLDVSSYSNSTSIESYYLDELDQFEDNVDLLVDFTRMNNSIESKIIELKLVSYFVIIDLLLGKTKLGEIISQYPDYLKYAYKLIDDNY